MSLYNRADREPHPTNYIPLEPTTSYGSASEKIHPTGAVSLQLPSDGTSGNESDFHVVGVTSQQYFVGAFLPTILAVLFTIPCQLLASALQEMEPYYQLQRPGGASASLSILLNYKSSINVIATVNAMRRGHFLVWWSGLVSLAVLLLAPLASEAVFIGFVGQGVCTATSGRSACIPRLGVYLVAARVAQGILAFVAVLTFALAIAISLKNSGVFSNPLSIASIATLFQNQYLLEEVRRLDPYAVDRKALRTALEGQRYRIGSDGAPNEDHAYGLVVCQTSTVIHDDGVRTQMRGGKKYASVAISTTAEEVPSGQRTKPKMTSTAVLTHPIGVLIYGLLVAGLEVLVLYYNRTGGDTGFERFMDSQSLGVTFLFTAVGVGIKMYWTLLDDGKLCSQT